MVEKLSMDTYSLWDFIAPAYDGSQVGRFVVKKMILAKRKLACFTTDLPDGRQGHEENEACILIIKYCFLNHRILKC